MGRRALQTLIAIAAVLAVGAPASVDASPAYEATIRVSPNSGPAGIVVTVHGRYFPHQCGEQCNGEFIGLKFTDSLGSITWWPSLFDWGGDGRFTVDETIPSGAALGQASIQASHIICGPFGCLPGEAASRAFTVSGMASFLGGRLTPLPFTPSATKSIDPGGPVRSNVECTTLPSPDANVLMNCPEDSAYPSPEIQLAADPSDPSHLVAVSFDTFGFFALKTGLVTTESYTSFDSGQTWTNGDISLPGPQFGGFDPTLTFDARHGTVIAGYVLSFLDQSGVQCDGDLVVAVSTNGGLDWGTPVSIGTSDGCSGSAGPYDTYDKDWVLTDNHPGSPHYGRTYAVSSQVVCTITGCTTDDGTLTFDIVEAHSDDGGFSWSTPQVISGSDPTDCSVQPNPPACDNATSAFPAVSPDGSVHVAFEDVQHAAAWEAGECCENQYLVVNSTNGGATWSNPVPVVDLEDGNRDFPGCFVDTGSAFCPLTGTGLFNAAFGEGNLVASPIDGTLYLVFADNRNGVHDSDAPLTNTDVFVLTSTDGGTTWTAPDVVSDAPGDQFFPFADVDPVSGQLGVVFYDRSNEPSTLFDVTLATGRPGSPFTSTRVTTRPSHFDKDLWLPVHGVQGCEQCVAFIGDYIALAYGSDGTANMAWTDLRRKISVPHFGSGYTENTFYSSVGA